MMYNNDSHLLPPTELALLMFTWKQQQQQHNSNIYNIQTIGKKNLNEL